MIYKFLIAIILTTNICYAKILDKVAGVINDQVYTLSQIQKIKKTMSARKEITPFIYSKSKYSDQEILRINFELFVIRDKLGEMGFVISDDSVESRIKDTEKRLGLTRDDLLNFLSSKGITFAEYFELIRSAMEYNIFSRRIIAPLVNITEQEVKNFYYKMNSKNNALSFKYEVVDFFLPQSIVKQNELSKLRYILEEYQKTGNIPSRYKDIETSDLGKVADDDLPKDLSKLLQKTDEGRFSKSYIKNGLVHVFYVKKKDLTASEDFLKRKDYIYNQIFIKRAKSVKSTWLNKELLNYYTLENI